MDSHKKVRITKTTSEEQTITTPPWFPFQVYRKKYYIATDECGTPVMVFNQYGEVVREMMRSPYGHIMYDSNPYLYLPVDYCGGLLETRTELVHMPRGRIYDPLIGK